MLFFGVCFFLYFIKLSAGNGFCMLKRCHRFSDISDIAASVVPHFGRFDVKCGLVTICPTLGSI